MSKHVFSEIFLHITWHTKDNTPVLTATTDRLAREEIQRKCMATDGIYFHDIGGTETHLHLVISIEPSVLISEFIGQVKGASSYCVNKQFEDNTLDWQPGYGVVSFSKRDLPWVLQYVARPKEHHTAGTLSPKLEMTNTPEKDMP